jgi:hypothetical protein
MKESYEEDLADHFGLNPYAGFGDKPGVASERGTGRPATELRNPKFRVPTLSCQGEGNTLRRIIGKRRSDTAESKNLCMPGNFKRENREILLVSKSNFSDVESVWVGQKTPPVVQLT